jgi:hypothetical protein
MWRRTGGYSEAEASTIIRYQFLSLLGIVLGFLSSTILGIFLTS